jgi:ABC-2 type transport system permease protein
VEGLSSLRVAYAIWYREILRFFKDRSRWLGFILQPLLYLLLIGNGIAHSMRFASVPAGGQVNYLVFMYPGIVGMSILFTSIFSGVGILWDREFGFLKEVLAAPVARWVVALGKAWGIATIAGMQSAVLLALAPLVGVRLGVASALELVGVAVLLSLALGSLGILVASRMQTTEGFQFIMNLFTLPMFFLSGAMYPLRGLPAWLMDLARVDPLSYGVDALRHAAYASWPPGQLLLRFSLGLDVAVVAALAVAFSGLAAWAFSAQG